MNAPVPVLGSICTHVSAFRTVGGAICQYGPDLYPDGSDAHISDVTAVPVDSDVNCCAIFRLDFDTILE